MPEINDKFNFSFPVDVVKGKNDGEWRIRGIASTEHLDLQGEVVRQDGLDITPLKEGQGLFNWDHKDGPQNVLGCIDLAEKTKKGLYVEGYLLKESEAAKSVHNILKSLKEKDKKRLQMSIQGKILRRGDFNEKEVARARIDEIALTFKPVNPNTYAELVKSLSSISESNEVSSATTGTITISPIGLDNPDNFLIPNEGNTIISQELSKISIDDEIKTFIKSSVQEIFNEYKDNNKNEQKLLQTIDDQNKTSPEIIKSNKKTFSEIKEQITSKILSFAKSKSAILTLGQEICDLWAESGIYGDVSTTEDLYAVFKKAVDAMNEKEAMSILPKVMKCWREEGIGLNNEKSQIVFKKAIEFLGTVKKALNAGCAVVAPDKLENGDALKKESLKHKKTKKEKENGKSDTK